MAENPFTPSFGEIPAHLAGRRQVIIDFERALTSRKRRPELTTLFTGARGTGKTTLLSLLGRKAESNGWITANTTSSLNMLDDLEVQVYRRASHLLKGGAAPRITKMGIPQTLEVSFSENTHGIRDNWRSRIEDALDALAEVDCGLLITVDEVDSTEPSMVELASVYQHFVREDRRVGLLMAGLPHSISSLLNDKTVSFMRRAELVKLGMIADHDIASALRKTIEENGRSIADASLSYATSAIQGFPFLMQLVGFRAWDEHPDRGEITEADVRRGVELARYDLETRILAATFRELSGGDVGFLLAMLPDEGDTAIADVVKRTGKSSSLVSQYRRRLIEAGVIGERRRGVIGFDLPFFKEYLKKQLE